MRSNQKVDSLMREEREQDFETRDDYSSDDPVEIEQLKSKDPVPFWQRKTFTVPGGSDWPAPVRCKMNVKEWETLMLETGLEQDIPYIVNGFTKGFCLGIPQHEIPGLPWYTPENHRSAVSARKQIEQTLKKEKEAGRLLGPYTHQEVAIHFGFFCSNPMGGAVNGDGSIRIVNNLSHPKKEKGIPSVNLFVDKLNYGTHWDDFDRVALFFQENPGEWEVAIFDWQKAYRQLPAHPSQRK